MLSKGYQRHFSFLEPLKLTDTNKQAISGTLSPDTITTISSGYSTGGSSLSSTIVPSLKDHNQHKMKSKSKQMWTRNDLYISYFDIHIRHLLFLSHILSSTENNIYP